MRQASIRHDKKRGASKNTLTPCKNQPKVLPPPPPLLLRPALSAMHLSRTERKNKKIGSLGRLQLTKRIKAHPSALILKSLPTYLTSHYWTMYLHIFDSRRGRSCPPPPSSSSSSATERKRKKKKKVIDRSDVRRVEREAEQGSMLDCAYFYSIWIR